MIIPTEPIGSIPSPRPPGYERLLSGWFAIVTGIALDGGDCVYVADFYNHRFQRWHSETEEISHGAVSLRIDPIHHPISQMTVRIAFVRQFPALEWDPCSISLPDTIPPTVTSLGKQKP